MTPRLNILVAVAVAAAQIGFLGWMIVARAAVLRDGQEIMLKVEPVDPRDWLRGDYVRLGYAASRIPGALFVDGPPSSSDGLAVQKVWVRFQRMDGLYWLPVSARLDKPFDKPAGEGQVDVLARQPSLSGSTPEGRPVVSVNYGIDRYYVPEGEGREIEKGIGERPFGVLAAIGSNGATQIKALMDGDKPLYVEPPY